MSGMLSQLPPGCCYDDNMMNSARLWEEERKTGSQTGNVAKSRHNLKDTTARLLRKKKTDNYRSIPQDWPTASERSLFCPELLVTTHMAVSSSRASLGKWKCKQVWRRKWHPGTPRVP